MNTTPPRPLTGDAFSLLTRNSCSWPHPSSLYDGFCITHASMFAPLHPGTDQTYPFPLYWRFNSLHFDSDTPFGFGKAFYSGYAAFSETDSLPDSPPINIHMGRLRYRTATLTTAHRLAGAHDAIHADAVDSELWALPIFETAPAAFLRFVRNGQGGGDIFLQADGPLASAHVCLYRIAMDETKTVTPFCFSIPSGIDTARPIGSLPHADKAYIRAVLLQRPHHGGLSAVQPARFAEAADSAWCRQDGRQDYGRQSYPSVFIPAAEIPQDASPEAHYERICSQLAEQAVQPAPSELFGFVRELDACVATAEYSGADTKRLDDLHQELEKSEERLIPRLMEQQQTKREQTPNAPAVPLIAPCDALALLDNEVHQAWTCLRDIRFRRLPALHDIGRETMVPRVASTTDIAPITHTTALFSLPETGKLVALEHMTSTLLVEQDSGMHPVQGPWQGITAIRPCGNGFHLLDSGSQQIFHLNGKGEVQDVIPLSLTFLTPKGLTPTDLLCINQEIYLMCLADDAQTSVCVRLDDADLPSVLFRLDQNVIPFEKWEAWNDNLVLCSSKTNSLALYSLQTGTWKQRNLPICHSGICAIAVCENTLFILYPPALVMVDLPRLTVRRTLYMPETVGMYPMRPLGLHVEKEGDSHRLHVAASNGTINSFRMERSG